MKNLILFILLVNSIIIPQEILYEGEIKIKIINVTFPPNQNWLTVQFQAVRIYDKKWYPDLYPPVPQMWGRLFETSEFDTVNSEVTLFENAPGEYYIYFDVEYDAPPISLALSKYQISAVGKSTVFRANILECGGFPDYVLTYDYNNDKLYLGSCSDPTNCGDPLPLNYELHNSIDRSCLELFLTISNQNGNPYLEWNPYHDPNILDYKIYKKLTTESGTQTFNYYTSSTSYLDEMFNIDPKFGDDQVEYWITARISSSVESLEGNHVQIDGTSFIQWKISTQEINNETDFRLNQNFPNPFNPSTQIKYSLAQDADVTLKVYGMLGTEVSELVNETQTAGSYEINFSSEGLSSGVYIYRITATNNGRILFTDSKQMILLR